MAKPDQADLVLYNTCSIRDKAEQKVFHRLDEFKRHGKGKVFGVLGCVAQQEGERIFERAPHVSLVAGSASYARLPEMLVQLETGNRRVTGLTLDNDQAFETPFTERTKSASRLHHHHRRLRQSLRLLRGAVHARTGAQPHQRQRLERSARAGPHGLRRSPVAWAERQ